MLRRKYARLCMALLAAPWLELAYIVYSAWAGRDCTLLQGCVLITVAALFGGGAVYVRLHFLRCPHCGKEAATPQWKPGRRRFCPRCGEPFLYDDEADE